jgi:hypothetical protein
MRITDAIDTVETMDATDTMDAMDVMGAMDAHNEAAPVVAEAHMALAGTPAACGLVMAPAAGSGGGWEAADEEPPTSALVDAGDPNTVNPGGSLSGVPDMAAIACCIIWFCICIC